MSVDFDKQTTVLGALNEIHDKFRQTKINSLKRQLAVLEGRRPPPTVNGPARTTTGKGRGVRVKYRDPKTGDTWSGRGRMARWLADKVKAGEKADRYLV